MDIVVGCRRDSRQPDGTGDTDTTNDDVVSGGWWASQIDKKDTGTAPSPREADTGSEDVL